MDQLGRLAVAQVVGQLVQLLGVVLVVAQHIGQHSHPLLQAGVAVVMGVIVVMVVMMLAHSDAPPCFFAHFSTARGQSQTRMGPLFPTKVPFLSYYEHIGQ